MKTRLAAIAGIAATAVAALLTLRRGGLREDLDWAEIQKPGAMVEIDGYGVHYVESGAGPAIIFVHGFGGSTYNFRDQLAALSSESRVVAVDLKGFGYSERDPHTGLAATDQVRMLRSFVEALRIDHAVFVGHSMGGGIVQRYAATYPETVDAVVLAASIRAGQRVQARLPRFIARPIASLIARYVAPRTFRLAYAPGASIDDTVREQSLRPLRVKGTIDGLLAMADDRSGDDAVDLARLRQPVLLLWGDQDRIVPLRTAERIRRDLPQARLVVVHGAGHMLFEERPRDCNAAIRDFIRDTVTMRPAVR
jgi:pimeloyl-ACP methyl ester carboxylesterase